MKYATLTSRLSVAFTPATIAAIAKVSTKRKITAGEFVRRAVLAYIKAGKEGK